MLRLGLLNIFQNLNEALKLNNKKIYFKTLTGKLLEKKRTFKI